MSMKMAWMMVEMMVLDKPNSKNQKYRKVEK